MRGQYIIMIIFSGLSLASCDLFEDYESGYFGVEENFDYNGRVLCIHYPDSNYLISDTCDFFEWDFYDDDPPVKRINTLDEFERKHQYYLYLHRSSGRIDTVNTFRKSSLNSLGYIQRYTRLDSWIVFEAKPIYEILGRKNTLDGTDAEKAYLSHYSYEGQKELFDSPISYFWIADRSHPDLYGPLNMEELQSACDVLGIEKPLILKGIYDRYVYECIHEDGWQKKMPRAFKWPFWDHRDDLTIE